MKPITVIHKLADKGNTVVIKDSIEWCKDLIKKF